MLHSASFRDHSFPLFHKQKFADLVPLENGRFVNKCFNKNDFSLFSNLSNLIASSHSYCTRSISNGLMFKRFYSPNRYGNKSIIISQVSTWNHFKQYSMVTTFLICYQKNKIRTAFPFLLLQLIQIYIYIYFYLSLCIYIQRYFKLFTLNY